MSGRCSSNSGTWARRLALALVPFASVACIEPFETPAEYDSQRYLCSDEHQDAWAEAIDDCLAEPACGGVVSFQGRLEGVPVTVESVQNNTIFRRIRLADGDEVVLERMDTFGASPYFTFGFKMKSIGGSATEESTDTRQMLVDPAAERADDARNDDALTIDLRLTGGNESVELSGLKGGKVELTKQGPSEIHGTFSSSFGKASDRVEGCFALFATSVNTSGE